MINLAGWGFWVWIVMSMMFIGPVMRMIFGGRSSYWMGGELQGGKRTRIKKNEVARLETRDLSDHQRQQGIGRDVERYAEEYIGAPLVELTGQPSFRDVEQEQHVARRQRHLFDFPDVPCADDQAAAVGIIFDLLDDLNDLMDGPSVRGSPVAPLRAIDAAEVPLFVRPFVPDGHTVFVQPLDVGVAAQEPEQFVDD